MNCSSVIPTLRRSFSSRCSRSWCSAMARSSRSVVRSALRLPQNLGKSKAAGACCLDKAGLPCYRIPIVPRVMRSRRPAAPASEGALPMAAPTVCATSPCYSIQIRLEIDNIIGKFAQIAMAIGMAGGNLGAVDIVRVERGKIIRDVTVDARDAGHEREIVQAIKAVGGVKVVRTMDRTFTAHEGGKIEIRSKMPIRDRNDLSQVYTPGVARVCMDIHDHPGHVYRYTIKKNTV